MICVVGLNIKFNHGCEVFKVCCGLKSILMSLILMEGCNKPYTEDPRLNVIITHSKFICSPFMGIGHKKEHSQFTFIITITYTKP